MRKHQRLGPRVVRAAESRLGYRDVHAVIGGTGAVGGTAVLKTIAMYEEMFGVTAPAPDDVPVIVATGQTRDEHDAFSRRLFNFERARHGAEAGPIKYCGGWLTHSGVFVRLERLSVGFVPGLPRLSMLREPNRRPAVERFLGGLGVDIEDGPAVRAALEAHVAQARPFSSFLESYRSEHLSGELGVGRYRSALIGIPIATLIAYNERDLEEVCNYAGGLDRADASGFKTLFVQALVADIRSLSTSVAERVVMAHTTGVGGMYDVEESGAITPRLGFAHAGFDRHLVKKHEEAERLTDLYVESGADVLVTAAAIGVDEVHVRQPVRMNRGVRQKLYDAGYDLIPHAVDTLPSDAYDSVQLGEPAPRPLNLQTFRPLVLPLAGPSAGPVKFTDGRDIKPSYSVRSGENGIFSVANADALYRVMRVASTSELGVLLAGVTVLGDDPQEPWFDDHVCYYTETDNSRYVFDFLGQPALRRSQITGLDPMALQDLGSAKHQAELHLLGLLILLHRLRTLDIDALDPYVDPASFDPDQFFVANSRALTFEDIALWSATGLADDLSVLVSATEPYELVPLLRSVDRTALLDEGNRTITSLFSDRDRAMTRVLERVIEAVWKIPSLGTPVIFNRDGEDRVLVGYYVAPLDIVVSDEQSLDQKLRDDYEASGRPCRFETYRDWVFATHGFIDLRLHAVVSTARSADQDLENAVTRHYDAAGMLARLREMPRYSMFSTSGVLATLTRLRGLYASLKESMIGLGSLQDYAWSVPRDERGHLLVVPGAVEALRMVAEGAEKATGTESLDGAWGYERWTLPDRRADIDPHRFAHR